MLQFLYDSDSIRGSDEGGSFFGGYPVGAPDGQNPSVFVVFGANCSIKYCSHLTNSLGKG